MEEAMLAGRAAGRAVLVLAGALLLAGCADARSTPGAAGANAQPPIQVPLNPSSAQSMWIRYRRRGSEEEIDDCIEIRRVDGKETDGVVRLSSVVARSDAEDRERRYAISSIVAIMPGDREILGRAAIMHWFRCMAGIATDAENLEAGIAASEAEAEEDGELLARRLRILAWVRYGDRDGILTERQITITAVGGCRDDDAPVATVVYAYCHLRRAARSFLVDRIVAIAANQAELQAATAEAVEAWLLEAADRPKLRRRRRRTHGSGHG
jgi:hypothetical protein